MFFRISNEKIVVEALQEELINERAGGYVSFEGWVRNHNEGQSVLHLEYEAFVPVAKSEALLILREAKKRFNVLDLACVHRVGDLQIGEKAVWVGAVSAHREAAFRACRYVIDQIKLRLPIWKKEHYLDGRAEWVNCQECYRHSHHYENEKEEREFYTRQRVLSEVGEQGQAILKKSRALVVGAGGLGAPALMALAGAGVGHIEVIDGDLLEASNLHRQNIYKYADIGQPKAELAAEILHQYNPFIHVRSQVKRVNVENVMKVIENQDIILDCTDNFQSKYLLHDACRVLGTPLVQASVYKYEGELQLFSQGEGEACLRCHSPEMPEEGCAGNCQEVGTMASATQVIGSMQVQMAIDFLLEGKIRAEKIFVDVKNFRTQNFQSLKNENCNFCSEKRFELDPKLLNSFYEWEVQKEERGEFEEVDIRGWDEKDLTSYLLLPKDRNYLLICQRGIRSRHLVKELRAQKQNHFYSLIGGMEGLKAMECL